ncbi:MAG: PAS domain S-box protein, partial [Verrucomicrobiia bacterium]
MTDKHSRPELAAELEDLRARLAEAEEVLRAIRNGEVDAVVVAGERGEQVYTLSVADEQFINNLINAVDDVFYVFDIQGNFIRWNKAFEKVSGYSHDEVARMKSTDFFTKEGAANITDAIQEAFRKGHVAVEEEFITKDGRRIPMFFSGSVIEDLSHQRILCGIGKNITELKQKETQLRASEARYRSYIDVTGRIAWVTNADGEIEEDVPSFRKFTGQTYEEAKGSGWVKALHPDDLAHTLQAWNKAVSAKSSYEVEYRMRRHDGIYRHFLARGFPVFKEDGSILEWVGTCIDITERKRMEDTLRDSEARYRAIFQASPDGILIADIETKMFKWANPALCRMLGYTEEELRTMSVASIHPKDALQRVAAEFEAQARGDKTLALDMPCLRKDGTTVYADINAIKITFDGRACNNGFFRDITERKRAEADLENLHKQLLDSSRQAGMAEVVTDVLHNVGNVLNSVNVSFAVVSDKVRKSKVSNLAKAAGLLQEHEHDLAAFLNSDPKGTQLPGYLVNLAQHLAEEQAEILKELQLLSGNVEHIKEIVAMQQGYYKVSGAVELLPVAELVEDALRMNAATLAHHDVQIVREYAEAPPVLVEKHKVLQILVNLIGNAKYALDEGG